MKTDLWVRSVKRYVLPELPGSWNVRGPLLYREPVDWLLCCISLDNSRFSSNFSVARTVQLLAVPSRYLGGPESRVLGQGAAQRSLWEAPETVADAESVMGEVLDHIRREAMPVFDSIGTLPGYQTPAEERAQRQPNNVHYQEEVFCLRLIQGDTTGALRAAKDLQRSNETRSWADAIRARVAHTAEVAAQNPEQALDMLRDNIATSKANLRLPTWDTQKTHPWPVPKLGRE